MPQNAPDLILEHTNFKIFPGGACMPPDPPRLDGIHGICPPSHVSPPILKDFLMPLYKPLAIDNISFKFGKYGALATCIV